MRSKKKVRKLVSENTSLAQKKQAANYNVGKINNKRYNVEDKVLIRDEKAYVARSELKFYGPFTVIRCLDNDKYVLFSKHSGRTYIRSSASIRPANKPTVDTVGRVRAAEPVVDGHVPKSSFEAPKGTPANNVITAGSPKVPGVLHTPATVQLALTPDREKLLGGSLPTVSKKAALMRRRVEALGDITGRRVKVWWPQNDTFFLGTIAGVDDGKLGGTHVVKYDDGDEVSENLGGWGSNAEDVEWDFLS
jgi:hypothetical protein